MKLPWRKTVVITQIPNFQMNFTYTIFEISKSFKGLKILIHGAQKPAQNFPLYEYCEAFVQPKMFEVFIGH